MIPFNNPFCCSYIIIMVLSTQYRNACKHKMMQKLMTHSFVFWNTSSQFMFITQQNHFTFMINIHVMVNC